MAGLNFPLIADPLDLVEYHDDGIFLGDPSDPEEQKTAFQNLLRTAGPEIPPEDE